MEQSIQTAKSAYAYGMEDKVSSKGKELTKQHNKTAESRHTCLNSSKWANVYDATVKSQGSILHLLHYKQWDNIADNRKAETSIHCFWQVVGFCPTGWMYEMSKKLYPIKSKGTSLHIHLVPYSEHSRSSSTPLFGVRIVAPFLSTHQALESPRQSTLPLFPTPGRMKPRYPSVHKMLLVSR